MSERARHVNTYRILRRLVTPIFKRLYAMEFDVMGAVEGPYIVVPNHCTELDPALVGLSFPEQMYFVASEHLWRKGFISFLLKRYFAPICRIKGSTAATTVMDILRHLKKGYNVCLFAEGDRTFNGLTGPILKSTGKMLRAANVTLVTYNFEGGYFTNPRWAYNIRRGRMYGRIVGVYPPEQLKAMTNDEVNELLVRDLHDDAYSHQYENPVEYRAKGLAEGLEHALFICPECAGIGTLSSEGDMFSCGCGLRAKYLPTGFLEGGRFDTVTKWDLWQQDELKKLADNAASDAELFHDNGMRLLKIGEKHRFDVEAEGRLSMSLSALTVEGVSIPVSDITEMSMHGRATVVFSTGATHYELRADSTYCGRKYVLLYNILSMRGR